jgi:hypothetical protein
VITHLSNFKVNFIGTEKMDYLPLNRRTLAVRICIHLTNTLLRRSARDQHSLRFYPEKFLLIPISRGGPAHAENFDRFRLQFKDLNPFSGSARDFECV